MPKAYVENKGDMTDVHEQLMRELIVEFSKMPTIGLRTAERLTYYILNRPAEDVERLCQALRNVNGKIGRCQNCNHFTQNDLCDICCDERRDQHVLCVVEASQDLTAIEKTGRYQGLYHVLMGRLSPLDGLGPEDIDIKGAMRRLKSLETREVILATNTTTEGETTALYMSHLIRKEHPGLAMSRIAYGLAVGADLEFTDTATLGKSLDGRQKICL